MKNLKNIATAATMTAILALGTFNANAGLMLSDSVGSNNQCVKTRTFNFGNLNLRTLSGILASGLTGIMVSDKAGLMLSDGMLIGDSSVNQPCREGLLMSDGLVLSGRTGMLISD